MLGVILGCAAATKLTGWFLPLPFLAWAVLYRSRPAFTMLCLALAVAMVVLFVLMPPWWSDPIGGVVRFFNSNLSRGETHPDPGPVLAQGLQDAQRVAPVVQHAGLDGDGHAGGLPGLGVLGLAAAVARRRSEPIGLLIGGPLGVPDDAAGDAAHARP